MKVRTKSMCAGPRSPLLFISHQLRFINDNYHLGLVFSGVVSVFLSQIFSDL